MVIGITESPGQGNLGIKYDPKRDVVTRRGFAATNSKIPNYTGALIHNTQQVQSGLLASLPKLTNNRNLPTDLGLLAHSAGGFTSMLGVSKAVLEYNRLNGTNYKISITRLTDPFAGFEKSITWKQDLFGGGVNLIARGQQAAARHGPWNQELPMPPEQVNPINPSPEDPSSPGASNPPNEVASDVIRTDDGAIPLRAGSGAYEQARRRLNRAKSDGRLDLFGKLEVILTTQEDVAYRKNTLAILTQLEQAGLKVSIKYRDESHGNLPVKLNREDMEWFLR